MIEKEYFRPVAYALLVGLTFIDLFFHIDQLFMVLVFTNLLVYIGSINSAKVFNKDESSDVETMKQKDAWLFPVIGSAVLFGLFIVFKYINKDYINILFLFYFSIIGSFSVGTLIYQFIYNFSVFKPYTLKDCFTIPKIPFIVEKSTKVNQLEVMTFAAGSIFGFWYFFKKNWVLNNLFGCCFSIFGIENMVLGEFKNGAILLVLLFFYDIFWVFFTPVMVNVAKNLDGPIKLMFPKMVNYESSKDFNLIGLGDIVIPGIYVAFMLRFDIVKFYRKNKTLKGLALNFSNFTYFFVTLTGYFLGIFVTLSVMVVFAHAQPALLYLVPGILIPSIVTAVIKGEFSELWAFNEDKVKGEFAIEEKKSQ